MGCKFLFSWLLFILGIFEASSWRASRPLKTNLWLFHGFAKHSAKLTKLSSVACCSTMASLLNAASISPLQQKANHVSFPAITTNMQSKIYHASVKSGRCHLLNLTVKARAVEGEVLEKEPVSDSEEDYGVVSVHHVGILCENLETSLDFYQNILGLKINEARPHDKLPYRGAWLWVGSEMIHLMELPNPDPLTGRPAHGGRDRHTCIAIRDVSKLKVILDKAGIPYTLSRSGRPAIFTRDPDANALEFTQVDA